MLFLFTSIMISFFIAITISVGCFVIFDEMSVETMFILCIVCFCFSMFGLYVRKGKNEACPQCGKSFAMVEIKRIKKFEFASKKTVQKEIKNKNGDVIGYVDQTEPSTVYIYDCTDECKHCGYQRQIERREEY